MLCVDIWDSIHPVVSGNTGKGKDLFNRNVRKEEYVHSNEASHAQACGLPLKDSKTRRSPCQSTDEDG